MTINVVAQDLTKRYGALTAVDRVSLEIRAGEIFGILGPNGAGKTTLIESIVGLRRPDTGSIRIAGFDIKTHAHEVRQRVGLSLQSTSMPQEAKVIELARLYASLYADPVPVSTLLHQFGLEEAANARCSKLSGGLKQRLALALAIVGRPEVVFLDEPTTGLDPRARRQLWEHILALKKGGRTIVLTTHYMEEAERLCDRVAILDRGRLLALGSPMQLVKEYGPERAIEVEWGNVAPDPVRLAELDAVSGIMEEERGVRLLTTNPARTLLALAQMVDAEKLHMGDLRTRSATLEDVFLSLTGRGLESA